MRRMRVRSSAPTPASPQGCGPTFLDYGVSALQDQRLLPEAKIVQPASSARAGHALSNSPVDSTDAALGIASRDFSYMTATAAMAPSSIVECVVSALPRPAR